jgi:polyisoprenoid-binding protein YceI
MENRNNPFKTIALIITAIICLAATQLVMAQTTYKLAPGQDVYIKVSGSSNVHDWIMNSTVMESKGEFTGNGETLTALRAFSFQLAVKSLKSEHATMDSRMYKSVNESKSPTISYKLTSATVNPESKGKFLIASTGELTIAGVTKTISMEVTATPNFNGSITVSGSKKIQLLDYGIKPPSFMLGTMKVYNDLTIEFNLIYKK